MSRNLYRGGRFNGSTEMIAISFKINLPNNEESDDKNPPPEFDDGFEGGAGCGCGAG